MRATIPMQARKGRASYLGARNVGHQDPGATSVWLLIFQIPDHSEIDCARDGASRYGATLVGSRCGRFEPALYLLEHGLVNVEDTS